MTIAAASRTSPRFMNAVRDIFNNTDSPPPLLLCSAVDFALEPSHYLSMASRNKDRMAFEEVKCVLIGNYSIKDKGLQYKYLKALTSFQFPSLFFLLLNKMKNKTKKKDFPVVENLLWITKD